jgi:hypothetical protein
MTNYFEFMQRKQGETIMGEVINFEPPHREIEHVDSSTIVEKLELTPELRAEFEKAGYTFDDEEEK